MSNFTDAQTAQANRATVVLAQATAMLNNLIDVTNSVLITGTTVLPEQYDYASVPQIDFPVTSAVRPSFATPSALIPTAPLFSFSSVSNIALPADDLVAPTTTFLFAEQPYVDALLDAQKAKLLDNLTNGGYGIETVDELALFERARDREVEAMMSRIDDAGRSMAARGFPLPPGELAIHIDRAYQGMADKVSSASRDITLKRADLYVDNRKFTISEVRGLEQILINFHNSVQERALNVARATVEMTVLAFNALVTRYKARLEGSKITSDVQLGRVQAEAEQARAVVEAFRGQVMAYELNLRALVETGKLNVDMYGHDIANARARNDALIAKTNLQAKLVESTITQNTDISRMTLENARVRLIGLVESLKFRTEAVKFGSSSYFAQLTALLSTVNTLAVGTGDI